LAWRDPLSSRWFPVGCLESDSDAQHYRFYYIKGAEQAVKAGFAPLASFPETHIWYLSEQLFPLFANRVPPPSRPEFRDYLQWLDLRVTESDPVAILARSGGHRVTDTLEIFPLPEGQTEEYLIYFPLDGLSAIPNEAATRAVQLTPDEPLRVNFGDPQDPNARYTVQVRADRTIYDIGSLPQYLHLDRNRWLAMPHIEVARVNCPPAPIQFRVLCKAQITLRPGSKPFDWPDLKPIVHVNVARFFHLAPAQVQP